MTESYTLDYEREIFHIYNTYNICKRSVSIRKRNFHINIFYVSFVRKVYTYTYVKVYIFCVQDTTILLYISRVVVSGKKRAVTLHGLFQTLIVGVVLGCIILNIHITC